MKYDIQDLHVSPYPRNEEIANTLTHGMGIVLSGLGLYLLFVEANQTGDSWKIWSSLVFGSCMIIGYSCSTLYHASTNPKFKHQMRIADHIGIYLMIAGTYTPFVLVNLRGWIGWTFFILIWGCAFFGICLRILNKHVPNYVSVGPYLFMGWLVIIGIKPLYDSIGSTGLTLIVLGGVFYSIGVVFYSSERIPFNHAIWHIFVLAGSISHYLAISLEVIPS
ncbi:hemolysin III family protein [Euryarchaeota archaeon]|nr:hemolysin III family protein [Euryarchaeota archaeon]